MGNNLVVRGDPGSGKTTLVLRVVESLAGRGFKPVGFVTEEIREGRTRLGFRIRDLDGEEAVMAHVERRGGPRVGRYGVDLEALEGVALRALEKARRGAELVVVDEIGKMEALSAAFLEILADVLDLPVPTLATAPTGSHPFLSPLLKRRDVSVYTIDRRSRDRVKEVIVKDLLRILGHG